MNWQKKLQKKYHEKCVAYTNKPVLDFLDNFKNREDLKYLEAGAGLGHFAKLIKNHFKNININCLEINQGLVDLLIKDGFNAKQGSITKIPFPDNCFDIVHCSHAIEHLDYPAITEALDEFFRIIKPNGYLIIRSPLMHQGFYDDIDHVRPYPPKAINRYFQHEQQQKQGIINIKPLASWERKEALQIESKIKGVWWLNQLLIFLWTVFHWPADQPNGYVAIWQKLS